MADYWYDSSNNKNLNTHRASGMPEVSNDGGKLAVASTNISVFANGMKIGFVQSLTPSESRTITPVQELGTEGVVQLVPSNTNGGQLSITRLAVYNATLYNALGASRTGQFIPYNKMGKNTPTGTASNINEDSNFKTFGNPFKTLKDQRVPLEIQVKTKLPGDAESTKYYTETYIDCWLASYSKTIAANTITVSETATIQYSDVVVV